MFLKVFILQLRIVNHRVFAISVVDSQMSLLQRNAPAGEKFDSYLRTLCASFYCHKIILFHIDKSIYILIFLILKVCVTFIKEICLINNDIDY